VGGVQNCETLANMVLKYGLPARTLEKKRNQRVRKRSYCTALDQIGEGVEQLCE